MNWYIEHIWIRIFQCNKTKRNKNNSFKTCVVWLIPMIYLRVVPPRPPETLVDLDLLERLEFRLCVRRVLLELCDLLFLLLALRVVMFLLCCLLFRLLVILVFKRVVRPRECVLVGEWTSLRLPRPDRRRFRSCRFWAWRFLRRQRRVLQVEIACWWVLECARGVALVWDALVGVPELLDALGCNADNKVSIIPGLRVTDSCLSCLDRRFPDICLPRLDRRFLDACLTRLDRWFPRRRCRCDLEFRRSWCFIASRSRANCSRANLSSSACSLASIASWIASCSSGVVA